MVCVSVSIIFKINKIQSHLLIDFLTLSSTHLDIYLIVVVMMVVVYKLYRYGNMMLNNLFLDSNLFVVIKNAKNRGFSLTSRIITL